MTQFSSIRLLLAIALCGAHHLHAQAPPPTAHPKPSGAQPFNSSQLPPSVPSSGIAPQATASTAPTGAAPASRTARRPEITFTQNQLTVRADNVSLNQILREIARLTGMKITGGVTDERVFGTYGPAEPAEVLNTLLTGTGSNVLLLAADAGGPGELILTPRNGGVTPPNPNAPGFDDDNGSDDAPMTQQRRGVSLFGPPQAADPQAQQGVPPAAFPTAQPPAPGTGPESPNGVKTPLQIFQQLQQLRLQQQQQQQQQPQPQQQNMPPPPD